jgi:hypothetical protein
MRPEATLSLALAMTIHPAPQQKLASRGGYRAMDERRAIKTLLRP